MNTRALRFICSALVLLLNLPLTTAGFAQSPATCVDHDGDGFGWDGTATCLIDLSSAACIDQDGDGWGWNGITSCRIDSTASSAVANDASACIDDDGDGFGWDGSRSCIPTHSNPGAATAGSAAACVDHDGDGYGWNGTSSCRVTDAPGQSLPSPAASAQPCIDSDGDGFGWNGIASCQISGPAGNPASGPAAITDLVLLTGQSNALGAGTAFDAVLDAPNPRVYAFTDTGWRIADLHQVWDNGWHPRTQPGTTPDNNLALHFGKRLASNNPSRVVGFVLATAPGQPIAHWQYNSPFYQSIRNKVVNAINQLPHKASLDGVLYHQGESDGQNSSAYGRALRRLIDDFRSEPWFAAGRPFICGETASLPVNHQLNSLNSDADRYTGCVAATDLPTQSDGQHFTAAGLRTLGQRYADRYQSMTAQ